jgi:hypothetical protein
MKYIRKKLYVQYFINFAQDEKWLHIYLLQKVHCEPLYIGLE